MKRIAIIALTVAVAGTASLTLPNSAHAQYRYGPAPVRGPVFNYGYAPMLRQPVPYGNVMRGFQSLPAPIYRSMGQAARVPTPMNILRSSGYILFYPQRAY